MMTTANSVAKNISDEELSKHIKPLSKNKILAFFQTIWRKWLTIWYDFSEKHPKASSWIYKIAFFIIFCEGVTIFQYLVTLFLPMALGVELAAKEFLWPKIYMFTAGGKDWYFNLLGYEVVYKVVDGVITNQVVIGGGLGYYIAFQVATFLAQVINFPLQRNITFKSHGNPYIQAMWYFIGWVLISLFCNGLNSLWFPVADGALGFNIPTAIKNIVTMVIMGGISMTIFFFIFLIIFPDYAAVEKRIRKKLEKLKSKGAGKEKIEKLEAQLKDAIKKSNLYNAEKKLSISKAQTSSKILLYFAAVKKTGKDSELSLSRYNDAVSYIEEKQKLQKEYETALAASKA